MDDRESTTSSIKQAVDTRGYRQVFRTIVVIFISAILLTGCYLFIPIGVVWMATKVPSSFEWLAAVVSIPSIWFLPGFTAIALVTAMELVAGQDDEDIERGWIFGIIGGSTILTAVWFLPLWGAAFPNVSETVQVLRAPAMFDDTWLMALSWVVSVPVMTYADLAAHTESDTNSDSSKSKQKEQSSSTNHTNQSTGSADRIGQDGPRITDEKTHDSDLQDLMYRWEDAPETRFADIGGMESLKTKIERSVLRPLTRINEAYERFKVSPPNGILLYGPPGTGKTLFARAVAGELGHPYLELSAGDIKSRWINESTEQVNRLFNEAQQFDRCVIFIDEIDALLAGRGNDLHREHAQVVNEFLAHLDDDDPNFLVIAATNRADLLDEAATRRGRFDQQYEIGLPDNDAREAIFRVRLRELPTALDERDYHELAHRSEELSSADIVGIVDDAAMHAAERDAEAITLDDLHESFPNTSIR
ncbi:26S protease regulatory subunit [Haladaptatus sp. YSMS36]|uniref:ATP-binding protein n=1 Tax=Haladaptatus sp. YSMS36 TaxID=3033384 RepID=UPI0023E86DD2|nr:ATP-binding protein [Haladaptatus sp. YSMS36]